MKLLLRIVGAVVGLGVVLASGLVFAQGDGQRTPTPAGLDLGSFFSATTTPTSALIPGQDGVVFEVDAYQLTVPNDWLAWRYDRTLNESANEQALEALVTQINPALVEDASGVIEQLVPPMIAAALAPEAPAGDLIFVTILEFGYQATLSDLQLPNTTQPAQVITALGFTELRLQNGLNAGFSLEEDSEQVSYVGGFAIPDRDRFIVLTGACDPTSWKDYGPAVTGIVESFRLSEATTPPAASTPVKPTPAEPDGLSTGAYDPAQLPLLTPINILYQQPYQFSLPAMQTGAIDLARLDLDATLEKIEGTDYYPPVTGYVQAAPTFAFYAQPTTTVGLVFAGTNYVDTVLLVRDPAGGWHFADDVKRANPDPALAVNGATEGIYEVWIGAKVPNQGVAGDLFVIVE